MLVGPALGGIGRQLALTHRPFYLRTMAVDDAHGPAAHFGNVAFLEENEASRHRKQRRHIRCHEVLILPQADHYRAALARQNQSFGLVLAHD